MKEKDCDHYFLSSTAVRIWQSGDEEGQRQMFACVSTIHKPAYFQRVVYRNKAIDDTVLLEMAENVFLQTWETFNANGRLGRIQLEQDRYTPYLFFAFKGNYLKSLTKE